MQNLNSLRVFARVVETRSFTEAGKQLALTASAVSKSISKLEKELGVRLLQRTTRSVGPTEEGQAFYTHCRQILADIQSAENHLGQSTESPHGTLHLHFPIGFGQHVIMPALPEFLARYPDLIANVELSDRTVDMIYEGIDATLHIGELSDSRLISRKVCELNFVVCASPSYLERHGVPTSPDDLAHHHCIAYRQMHTGRYREWPFHKDGRIIHKAFSGRLNVNNSESLLNATIAGMGIAMVSTFLANKAVKSGQLQVLLEDYACPGTPVSIVYPVSRYLAPKTRAFIDYIVELLGRDRY